MEDYEDVVFTPQSDATTQSEELIWLEKVGCIVLNYAQTDIFIQAEMIADILAYHDEYWDLLPIANSIDDYDHKWFLVGPALERKLKSLFEASESNCIRIGTMYVFRHTELLYSNHRNEVYDTHRYHFLGDPDWVLETISKVPHDLFKQRVNTKYIF